MSKRTWIVLPVAVMLVGGVFAGPAFAAPANDNFSAAIVLSGTRVSRSGDTNVGATTEPSEPPDMMQGGSVWYRWTPSVSGPAMINTFGSDFDTVLGVYTGVSVSALTKVVTDDDALNTDLLTSRVYFDAAVGTTYSIGVSAYGPDEGTIRLRLYEGPTSTNRVSLTETDLQIANDSWSERDSTEGGGAISSANAADSDGSIVAFETNVNSVVTGDTGGFEDVYVRDTVAGTTTRVSVDTVGNNGNGDAWSPSVSGDGNLVAFTSDSFDLVGADGNGFFDVFVRNVSGSTTTRVSVDTGGLDAADDSENPYVSSDGSHVAFESRANDLVAAPAAGPPAHVFLRNLAGSSTQMVDITPTDTAGNDNAFDPSLSSDGTKVVFESDATTLLGAGADTNLTRDVYLRDTVADTMVRVSVDSIEGQANGDSMDASVSADGTKVAFSSDADDLVASDTNGTWDVFVRDLTAGTTTRVSVRANGLQQIQGKGDSWDAFIDPGGDYVVFSSDAPNLVPNDTNGRRDIFLHDVNTGLTSRASVTTGGEQGYGTSQVPTLSGDGDIVWTYTANDLAPNDDNWSDDIYMRSIGFQVDALIKGPTDKLFAGDGAYQAVASGSQAKTTKAKRGAKVAVAFQVENDGSVSDRFNIIGCAKSSGFSLTYTVGGTSVTSAITGAGYHPAAIAPGDSKTINLTIKLSKKAKGTKVCALTATSDTDVSKVDQVKISVKALKK